jgi:hypothetical protein
MDKVKAKSGAMCAATQQMNNPGSVEFTGDAVCAVATRVANVNAEKKKQAAGAELWRVAETTAVGRGRGGCGRGGRGGRGGPGGNIPWKAAERNAQHQDEAVALQAHTRNLEAERAARGGGGGAPAADGEYGI